MQQRLNLIGTLLFMLATQALLAGPVSELKSDETLVFFNTSAWFNQDSNQWQVPIHGWVFEAEDSKVRKALIQSALETTYGLEVSPDNQRNFDHRVNALLADNERGKTVVIRFADRTYAIPESAENGHFSRVLSVDADVMQTATKTAQLTFEAVLADGDTRVFTGHVSLIDPHGVSIISDIDDTIKISSVTDRKQLLYNTFYKDFALVPGMAEKYRHWLRADGALHFVSSSPWQLYPALSAAIEKEGFPMADYALKAFRFRDSSLLNLFVKSTETKPPQIKQILTRYPNRTFILVGDSGEYDPEIYAKIQQQFPQQIEQILIRNVTNESADNLRFQALFKDIDPGLWQLFTTTEEINYQPKSVE